MARETDLRGSLWNSRGVTEIFPVTYTRGREEKRRMSRTLNAEIREFGSRIE